MHKILFSLIEGPFLIWLQPITLAACLIWTIFWYWKERSLKAVVWTVLGFELAYTVLITMAQYLAWTANPLTLILLSTKLDQSALKPILKSSFWLFDFHGGYFTFYVLGRFWLRLLLDWLIAELFFIFLFALKKYRSDFLKPHELLLAWVLALIVGWPNFLFFLGLTLALMLLISITKLLSFKQSTSNLDWPMIIACSITLVLAEKIPIWFHLTTLRI